MHQVTITIPTKVTDHQVTITTATQNTNTTNPTNRRNQLMYLSHHTDWSAKSNYTRSRRYYDICHSTGTGSNQNIYKTLGNEMFYGPEDPADQQEQPKQ